MIKVVGVYHYPADEKEFEDTLDALYGACPDAVLPEEEMEQAREEVAEHFEHLYLIEIRSSIPLQRSHWPEITQEQEDEPEENWQVPYDERKLDKEGYHWVFFFHYLDLDKPLITPFGKIHLPQPTELPPNLKFISYDPP